MEHDWIRIREYEGLYFPSICCATGERTDDIRPFFVYNDGILWQFLRILRLYEYIEIDVPMSAEAQRAFRRSRLRAVLKGIAAGGVLGVLGLSGGAAYMVEAADETQRNLGMVVAGCSIVLAPIAGAIISTLRAERSYMPAFFKLKGSELRVRFKNATFRQAFLKINQELIAR